jgi:hypothetical protein
VGVGAKGSMRVMITGMEREMEIAMGMVAAKGRRGNPAQMLMSGSQSPRARKLDERCDAGIIQHHHAYIQEWLPTSKTTLGKG